MKRCIRSRGATRKSTYKAPVAAAASTCCVVVSVAAVEERKLTSWFVRGDDDDYDYFSSLGSGLKRA